MSILGESVSHEEAVEEYLRDISNQLRLMNARLEDGLDTDIELDDITTLEESGDGT